MIKAWASYGWRSRECASNNIVFICIHKYIAMDILTDISSPCARIIDSLRSIDNIEQEARLGRYYNGDFSPGVSQHYFNDCISTLSKHIYPMYNNSIAIYFDK